MLAGELADAVSGDGGTVGVGFVVEFGQRVDEVEVVAFDNVEMVVGVVTVCHHLGEFGFVEGRVGEADRAGVDRIGREAGHDGDNGAGIDAAGEEGAERDFGDHAELDRLLQALHQFGAGVSVADRTIECEADIPIFARLADWLAAAE